MENFEKHIDELCKKLKLPDERFRVCRPQGFDLSRIEKAVIFVFAAWSGQSRASFNSFCELMKLVESRNDVDFIFFDADEIEPIDFAGTFGTVPHGYGEVYWIKCGRVKFVDEGYRRGDVKDLLNRRVMLFHRYFRD